MPRVLRMTVEEYLRYDAADPWKNEYDDGVVTAVPSAGERPNDPGFFPGSARV